MPITLKNLTFYASSDFLLATSSKNYEDAYK